MNTYKEMASSLEQMVEAHHRQDIERLSEISDEIEGIYGKVYSRGRVPSLISIAYNFADCWADAANHRWQYHNGIDQNEWPILSLEISKCLISKKKITSEKILENFAFGNE